MKKLKILLRKGHHTAYTDLVRYPPEGVEYQIPKLTTASKSKTSDMLKKTAFKTYLKALRKAHAIYVNPSKDTDLIHATSGILIKNKFPWVIDTEHVASFAGFEAGRLEKVKREVEELLGSKYCKKIMPWSNAGKMSILNGLDAKKFKNKIKVIYPTMKPLTVKKQKHDDINILFVSVRFYTKGGREVLEAFDSLSKKYDVNLTIVSNVPEAAKQKYNNNKSIRFYQPNITRDNLLKNFFSTSDIFLLPSYMDTYGMVYLEAMNFSLPIVTTNTFALPEIVGNAGFLIDVQKFSWYGKNYLFAWNSWQKFEEYCERESKPDVVSDIIDYTSRLIDSSQLRKRMGKTGYNELTSGKFSIDKRNKGLRKVYEESLKS